MHRSMEIRHMSASYLEMLTDILDTGEEWRTFMFLIPKNLDDVSKDKYPLKYNGSNERILDTESQSRNCSPSKLLLEEWGTSGRVRPTVDHLLTLLIRADQMRAADDLTKLLQEEPPARPTHGPAAPIDVTLTEDHQTESILNGISYPSSTLLLHNVESITTGNNRDYYDKMGPSKQINFKENLSSIVEGELPVFSSSNNDTRSGSDSSDLQNPAMQDRYPDQLPGPSSPRKVADEPSVSNNREYPSEELPNFSALGLKPEPVSTKLQNDRNYACVGQEESSKIQNDHNYGPMGTDENEPSMFKHVPDISILRREDGDDKEENRAPAEHREDMPDLSGLLGGSFVNQRSDTISTNNPHSDDVPMLSMLGSDVSTSDTFGSESNGSGGNPMSNSQKSSSSPLVAAYSYDHLRKATDEFNTSPFTNGNVTAPNGRSLGAGGFGAVFLALDLSPSVPVAAVKRLDPGKYKFREKFQLELNILSKYSHPNVVSLLGCSVDGPQPCLVYEYLRDGNLEVALSLVRTGQRQLEASVRLQYLKDIANAISFLHEQAKIIHRDVKSANILLDGNVAKLCDFGIIKLTSSRTTTSIIGTNAYMAPEAVRGDVSPALDIFAFGIVIAETVSGEPVLAEKESRSEIDLAGYVCRQGVEGRDLGALVDKRAAAGNDAEWCEVGRKLLQIAIKCMGEKWGRPNSGALADSIGRIRLAPS